MSHVRGIVHGWTAAVPSDAVAIPGHKRLLICSQGTVSAHNTKRLKRFTGILLLLLLFTLLAKQTNGHTHTHTNTHLLPGKGVEDLQLGRCCFLRHVQEEGKDEGKDEGGKVAGCYKAVVIICNVIQHISTNRTSLREGKGKGSRECLEL